MNAVLAAIAVPFTLAISGIIGPGDIDGDGVLDSGDRCTQKAGTEQHLGCPFPVRESSTVFRPERRRTIRNNHWKPWSQPSIYQVEIILREEQQRWGGPWLGNRVACESGYNWSATNGQYAGLLQFGSIWSSMWAGTPRGVKYKDTFKVKLPIVRHTTWTDGHKTKAKIGKVTQKRTVIRKGKLPRYPDAYHGWAAIRVGQRAVSGDGPTTSWACGL